MVNATSFGRRSPCHSPASIIDAKKAFYKAVADGLNERLGLRREDVFINLVEVKKENWSFGNGVAQYA